MKPLILPVMSWIVPLLVFYKDGFDIKYPTKVDMPLNKEIKPKVKRSTSKKEKTMEEETERKKEKKERKRKRMKEKEKEK